LLPNFVKNIFEESVWRGYLTAKLINEKVKDIWLYLIVGGIWGVWHLPYFLVFLPQESVYQVFPAGPLAFTLVAIVTMLCWTVMYAELFRLTKSIWPLVLLHMVEDSLINHLVIDGHITIVAGKELWISPIGGIITTSLYLCVGLMLRRCRIKIEKNITV